MHALRDTHHNQTVKNTLFEMLKIIFYGTPHFAVACLASLVQKKVGVCAVVTAPDKPVGRGKKIKYGPVKEYCLANQIQLFQPENLKDPAFVNTIAELKPDLQIVVAFRMLPKQVWNLPRLGTFNLHASLLPNYRGAAPINWAVINGETHTGLTTFLIDEEIDTGHILLQDEIAMKEDETAASLYEKMLIKAPTLIHKTIHGLANQSIKPFIQKPRGDEKPAPKLHHENTRIDWKMPMKQITNLIRGLNPIPGAWTFFNDGAGQDLKMKLFEGYPIYAPHSLASGLLIVENKKLLISTPEGYLDCTMVQLPNKRKMAAKDLLNGYSFNPKATVF